MYPTLPDWPTCAFSYGKCLSNLGGQNQVISKIGGLSRFSYEHIVFLEELEIT